MGISPLMTRVSRVQCYEDDELVCRAASGFFYRHEGSLYFITNQHVVIDERKGYYPDEIRLNLHTNAEDITQNEDYSVQLYGNNHRRVWREHPSRGEHIDVIALPLDHEEVRSKFVVGCFSEADHIPDDVDIATGEDVLVVGYPLGFYDAVNNLPVVRNAIISSVYSVPFEGEPLVLVDAFLHKGTSGSPVVTKTTSVIHRTGGRLAVPGMYAHRLVGVHSAEFDIAGRNPECDETLGLNAVWLARLIPEIISQGD